MRLADIGEIKKALVVSDLGADPLWSRTAEQLSGIDIQLFYARAGLRGLRKQALDLIDQAQAAVILGLFSGQLQKGAFAALVLHEPPPDPYMADEFIDGLVNLRPSRRGACIFMLESQLPAAAVTDLTWMGLDLRGKSQTSLDAITAAKATRHIRLPYVFWEWATPNIASPLLELGPTIEAAFGCSAVALQERYDRMIPIDRRSDAASLLDLVKQLGG